VSEIGFTSVVTRFEPPLVNPVRIREKWATWRCPDFSRSTGLAVGNLLLLCGDAGWSDDPIGMGVVTETFTRRFKELTDKDKEGHEAYDSDFEMIRTFRRYYGSEVGLNTKVTVAKFVLASLVNRTEDGYFVYGYTDRFDLIDFMCELNVPHPILGSLYNCNPDHEFAMARAANAS
jgi:hypothetical protein